MSSRLKYLLAVILMISVSGCAGWSPFGAKPKKPISAGEALAEASKKNTAKQEGNFFTTTFKKAKSTVSDAVKIEEKRLPAPDPTSMLTETEPVGADVHVQAARVYESTGKNELAIEQYGKALAKSPSDLTALVSMARLKDKAGDLKSALSYYRQAIEAHPKNPLPLNDLGLFLARHEQIDDALQALRGAVQLDPQRSLYRNNIATVLLELNREQEALAELLVVHPPAIAHYNMGYLLSQRGRSTDALRHFAQAVDIDPSFREARTMLARLESETQIRNAQRLAPAPPPRPQDERSQPRVAPAPRSQQPAAPQPVQPKNSNTDPQYLPEVTGDPDYRGAANDDGTKVKVKQVHALVEYVGAKKATSENAAAIDAPLPTFAFEATEPTDFAPFDAVQTLKVANGISLMPIPQLLKAEESTPVKAAAKVVGEVEEFIPAPIINLR